MSTENNTAVVNYGTWIAESVTAIGSQIIHNNNSYQTPVDVKRRPIFQFRIPAATFTGRKKELEAIAEKFSYLYNGERCVGRVLIIHGLPGMGKRTLVYMFVNLNRERFDFILEIDAQTEESVLEDFQRFARQLKLNWPQIAFTKKDVKDLLREAAEVYTRGLIIFVNAGRLHTDPKSGSFGIYDYLANDVFMVNKPLFLITSPNGGEAWDLDAIPHNKRLRLDRMENKEACAFLMELLGLKDLEVAEEHSGIATERIYELKRLIRGLAKILGGYPLSMVLIAGAINRSVRRELPLGRTLNMEFHINYYINLLAPDIIEKHKGEENYKAQLRTIFEETLERIGKEEHGETAKVLLGIIAYMPPEEVFAGFCNGILDMTEFDPAEPGPEDTDPDHYCPAVKGGLKILEAYSLISFYQHQWLDMIRVHPIVQEQGRGLVKSGKLSNEFQRIIEFTEWNRARWLPLNDTGMVELLLAHDKPEEVASQVLAAFWIFDIVHLPSSSDMRIKHVLSTKLRAQFMKILRSVSRYLSKDERTLLELGKLCFTYFNDVDSGEPDESNTGPSAHRQRPAQPWIFKILRHGLKLGKTFLSKFGIINAHRRAFRKLVFPAGWKRQELERRMCDKFLFYNVCFTYVPIDWQEHSRCIRQQMSTLSEAFSSKSWVLKAFSEAMSELLKYARNCCEFHKQQRANAHTGSYTNDVQNVNRRLSENWLCDQTIKLIEISSAPTRPMDIMAFFCQDDHVYIEGSKFAHILQLLATSTSEFSYFELSKYIKLVKHIPGLTHEDKISLLSTCGSVVPAWGEAPFTYLDSRGCGAYLHECYGSLDELLSLDGFRAAASECKTLMQRCESLMLRYVLEWRQNNVRRYKQEACCSLENISTSLCVLFALWAHQDASARNVEHINEFFASLQIESGTPHFSTLEPRDNACEKLEFDVKHMEITKAKCRDGVSEFLDKFKVNIHADVRYLAEWLEMATEDPHLPGTQYTYLFNRSLPLNECRKLVRTTTVIETDDNRGAANMEGMTLSKDDQLWFDREFRRTAEEAGPASLNQGGCRHCNCPPLKLEGVQFKHE